MGKTKNNQEIGPATFSRGGGFSALRGQVPPPDMRANSAWHQAQEKYVHGQQGTVLELVSDPLWDEVFKEQEDADDFATRIKETIDPELPADKLAELVAAVPRRLDYQQVSADSTGARMRHFRHLLAYPTAGVREFPLHLKKPLIDTFSELIDALEDGSHEHRRGDLRADIEQRLEDIEQEIDDLQADNPSGIQSLALENAQLVQKLYQLLHTSNDYMGQPLSDYQQHGRNADLAVLEELWEPLFAPGNSNELQAAQQDVIASWREAEYQGLLGALQKQSEQPGQG